MAKKQTKRRSWSKEEIIAAMQEWAAEYGEPPTTTDWRKSSPQHPTAVTVHTLFGSWSAAIEAAGFKAMPPHVVRAAVKRLLPWNPTKEER